MTTYTSADLLQRFNWLGQFPLSNDTISDTDKYTRLADAQNDVIADISARAPWTLYSKAAYASTPTLSTSDQQVFTFGTDVNGDPLFPEGKVMIYPSLQAIPDSPWREGVDYLQEGTQIRIPNNQSYGGTLYWRGIAPVLPISASNQPSLLPPPARMLIVYKAVGQYAMEGARNEALQQKMDQLYQRDFPRWMLVFKTQFANGGALGTVTGLQLAIAGRGFGVGAYGP